MDQRRIELHNMDSEVIGQVCKECNKIIDLNPASMEIFFNNPVPMLNTKRIKLPFHTKCLIEGTFLYNFTKECKRIAESEGREFGVDIIDRGFT